jgi:hypothetical protein
MSCGISRATQAAALITILFSAAAAPTRQADTADANFYTNAHPYFDQSLKDLTKQIPGLKTLQPASDQQILPEILGKTGGTVDDFFHYIVDLIADEKITQQRVNNRGMLMGHQEIEDSYLIVHRPTAEEDREDIVEYRMDAAGNPIQDPGLHRGYLVTFGFALICNYFSSDAQEQSTFRYLGEQKLGASDTYVVAFAQKPERSTMFVTMAGVGGTAVSMLMQGIAWIDKQNFQILRLRTDLLAPHPEIDLDRQTTEVTFDKVQLQDVAAPLWLPADVKVSLGFKKPELDHRHYYEFGFRNEHHYSAYRRYRVSVKILPPQ